MKKFLLLLCVLLASLGYASAQTSLVATLSHDGNITTFYSANALKDAYAAAVNGDVITLSSGNFVSPGDIAKNLTIRGAGMMLDAEGTIISGDIKITIPESEDVSAFTLEGVYVSTQINLESAQSPSFLKCGFNRFHGSYNSKISNTRFIHCIFNSYFSFGSDAIIVGS